MKRLRHAYARVVAGSALVAGSMFATTATSLHRFNQYEPLFPKVYNVELLEADLYRSNKQLGERLLSRLNQDGTEQEDNAAIYLLEQHREYVAAKKRHIDEIKSSSEYPSQLEEARQYWKDSRRYELVGITSVVVGLLLLGSGAISLRKREETTK